MMSLSDVSVELLVVMENLTLRIIPDPAKVLHHSFLRASTNPYSVSA
jgi:hypothetical protein